MTNRTTINVSKEAHQNAKEEKKDDESWSDYIQRCIDEPANVSNDGVDTAEIVAELEQAIDSMAFSGAISDEKADDILTKLKDLETEMQNLREAIQTSQR